MWILWIITLLGLIGWLTFGVYAVGEIVFLFDIAFVAVFGLVTICAVVREWIISGHAKITLSVLIAAIAWLASILVVVTRPYYILTSTFDYPIQFSITSARSGAPVQDAAITIKQQGIEVAHAQTDAEGKAVVVPTVTVHTFHFLSFTRTVIPPVQVRVWAPAHNAWDMVIEEPVRYAPGSYVRQIEFAKRLFSVQLQ